MIEQRFRGVVCALLLASVFVGCTEDAAGGDLPAPFIYADVPEPYPAGDTAACKAFAEADEGLTAEQAENRECYCDACLDLMRQCDALDGCTEMRQCAWRTGCTDANSCYLIGGACRTEIDKWGNGSVSAALNTELQACDCP